MALEANPLKTATTVSKIPAGGEISADFPYSEFTKVASERNTRPYQQDGGRAISLNVPYICNSLPTQHLNVIGLRSIRPRQYYRRELPKRSLDAQPTCTAILVRREPQKSHTENYFWLRAANRWSAFFCLSFLRSGFASGLRRSRTRTASGIQIELAHFVKQGFVADAQHFCPL